ncbi:glutathione S-transferase family protein [Propylenella binzhouense]|uniref:Glutathione S-transferase family protein n=1 Tax=Propylenella binzhouense TaxID=2555902 RepID=A0A964T2I6_9HYPH|nr:glutathione S-transferase family protein [Propylenella binzhouense]MYZ46724.1 glutathione S-transferase family protein [Propylenella binzhouense]
MGLLVDGEWHDAWYDTRSTGGRFERSASRFRSWVTPDGGAGPTGEAGFPAEAGRYHLYVSLACPWAHRTLILRKLKKLDQAISVSVVEPLMLGHGWSFSDELPDHLYRSERLYEIYLKADPHYTGRVTVPVLWDKERETIVSNESAEIIRMLNSAFDAFGDAAVDLYPEALRPEIDAMNERIYGAVNNGVYRAGFATTQDAYSEAFRTLFDTLEELDESLSDHRFLIGDQLTEADWRLFTTLVRFDAVYYGHFKCNWKRIRDYSELSGYLRDLFQVPGVKETVSFDHIKRHYYGSHRTINPTGIVPLGPNQVLDSPHDRGRFPAVGLPKG